MKKQRLLLALTILLLLATVFAACGNAEFSITFMVDGEVYATITTNGKDTISMPQNPTKDGYEFKGWYWDEGKWQRPLTANSLLDEPITADMKVYAYFLPEGYCEHNLTDVSATEATCQIAGNVAHQKCSLCGALFVDGQQKTAEEVTISQIAHTYDQSKVDSSYLKSPADCDTPAIFYKSCVCGAVDKTENAPTFESGNPTGHALSVLQKDETHHWFKCAKCDYTDVKVAHDSLDDGDCTTALICNCEWVVVEAKEAHDFTLWASDDTQHWLKCANCDVQDTENKANHDVIVDDGDCSTAVTCQCGKTLVEAKSHAWQTGDEWSGDNANHWRGCKNEGCQAKQEGTVVAHAGENTDCTQATVCEVCSKAYVSAGAHALTEVAKVDATCTTDGVKAHSLCSKCNNKFIDDQIVTDVDLVIAKLGHDLAWVSTDATQHWQVCSRCDFSGEKSNHDAIVDDHDCSTGQTCSCGKVLVTALSHSFANGAWNSADGKHFKSCANDGCNAIDTKYDHDTITDDGNCTTAVTCQCGEVLLPAKSAHDFTIWASDATQHWHKCANCDQIDTKSNHDAITDDNDCSTAVTCKCGKTLVEAKAHVWQTGDAWSSDNTNHWRGCTNDGCQSKQEGTVSAHAGTNTDCTQATVCSDCNKQYVSAGSHELGEATTLVPATCATTGTKSYQLCSKCNNKIVDGEIVTDADLVIATIAHDFDNGGWVTTDDTHHWKQCANCTAEDTENKIAHDTFTVTDCAEQITCQCGHVLHATTEHDFANGAWVFTPDQHWKLCAICPETDTPADHSYPADDGDCTTAVECACGYPSVDAIPHNFEFKQIDGTNNHQKVCQNAGCTKTEGEIIACSGGTAYCYIQAICSNCGSLYGDLTDHYLGWVTDDNNHYQECKNYGCTYKTESENHQVDHDPDCTKRTHCKCGKQMVDPATLSHNVVWEHDDTHHWKGCSDRSCPYVEGEKKAHDTFTVEDCTKQINCQCGYELYKANANHNLVWKSSGNSQEDEHWQECTNEGCTHKESAGNHKFEQSQWSSNHDGTHSRACATNGCNEKQTENCSGGTATCQSKAECSGCHYQYGSTDQNTHASENYTYTPNNDGTHDKKHACCGVIVTENEACSGDTGTGSCTTQATCQHCETAYGEPAHTWVYQVANGDDARYEHIKYCSVCDAEQANATTESHTYADGYTQENVSGVDKHYQTCTLCDYKYYTDCAGGTATCEAKATCSVCGNPHGSALGHDYSGEWLYNDDTDANNHYKVCANGCGTNQTAQHAYDQKVATEDYLVTGETSLYYYSCVCGKAGDQTFTPAPATCGGFYHVSDTTYKCDHCGTTLTITDEGVITAATVPNYGTDLILPDTVTKGDTTINVVAVGDGTSSAAAFLKNQNLRTVVIGNNITYIGKYAFSGCYNLMRVTIGQNLPLTSYTSTTEGEKVGIYTDTTSAANAFAQMDNDDTKLSKVLEVVLTNSSADASTLVGTKDCGMLFRFAKNVVTADSNGNYESMIKTEGEWLYFTQDSTTYLLDYLGSDVVVTTPETLNGGSYEIYQWAFSYNPNIVLLTISDGATKLGHYVGYCATGLYELVIGNNVTNIGDYAFATHSSVACSLQRVTLGSAIEGFDKSTISANVSFGYMPIVEVVNLSSLKLVAGQTSTEDGVACGCIVDDANTVILTTATESPLEIINGLLFQKVDGTWTLISDVSGSTTLTLPANIRGESYSINFQTLDTSVYSKVSIEEGHALYTSANDCILNKDGTILLRAIGGTVPSGVEIIEAYAFAFGNYGEVVLPLTINTIKANAFYNVAIDKLTINSGVIEIKALNQCAVTTLEIISATITPSYEYDSTAVIYKGSYTSVYINTAVIPELTFYGCSAISNMLIGEDVGTISVYAIYNSYTYNVNFEVNKTGTLTLPNNFLHAGLVGYYAVLTLNEGIVGLGKNILNSNTSTTSIAIPTSLKSMHAQTFNGWNGTVSYPDVFYAENGNPQGSGYLKIENDLLIDVENQAVILSFNKIITEIEIQDGIKAINSYAFANITTLTSVTIPASVTSIAADAFSGCTEVTSIVVHEGNTKYFNSKNCLIGVDGTLIICGKNAIGLPAGATSVPASAFKNNTEITEVVLEEGLTTIGDNAFDGCTNLTSITIPSTVTSIGKLAFANCPNLTEIIWNVEKLASDLPQYAYEGIFYQSGTTGNVSLTFGSQVQEVPKYFMRGYSTTNYTKVYSITFLGTKCTSIGNYAFYYCSNLSRIVIPAGVTQIGNYAFQYCKGMIHLEIPASVTTINKKAFANCTGLDSINFNAKNCTDIGSSDYVFDQAGTSGTGITLNIGDSVTKIPAYLFAQSSASNAMKIAAINFATENSSLTAIGNYAFRYVTGYTTLVLPEGLQTIGDYAFSGTTTVTSLFVSSTVTSIGKAALAGCTALKTVIIEVPTIGTANTITLGQFVFGTSTYSEAVPTNLKIYYEGSSLDKFTYYNTTQKTNLQAVTYLYSANAPELNGDSTAYDGNWWYYDTDGVTPIKWVYTASTQE